MQRPPLERGRLRAPSHEDRIGAHDRPRIRSNRRIDVDVHDLLLGEIGFERRLVDDAHDTAAHARAEPQRRPAGRRRPARRRAAGQPQVIAAVGMADQRKHRTVEGDAGDAEPVLPAGQQIAQCIREADAPRREQRLAAATDAHVRERRAAPTDPHVAEPHVVAEREARSALQHERGHGVMRDHQRDEEHRCDRNRARETPAG